MRTTILASATLLLALACSQPATTEGPTPYPLDTCLVTGEALDGMGGPVELVHEGQSLQFCCDACIKKFKAAPDTYLAKLEASR